MTRKTMTTNDQLRQLMDEHSLTRQQVAEMAMVNQKSTVDRWLVPPRNGRRRNPTFRHMPDYRLKLVQVAIRELQAA